MTVGYDGVQVRDLLKVKWPKSKCVAYCGLQTLLYQNKMVISVLNHRHLILVVGVSDIKPNPNAL